MRSAEAENEITEGCEYNARKSISEQKLEDCADNLDHAPAEIEHASADKTFLRKRIKLHVMYLRQCKSILSAAPTHGCTTYRGVAQKKPHESTGSRCC